MEKRQVIDALVVLKDILVHLDNADEFDKILYNSTRNKIMELYKLL